MDGAHAQRPGVDRVREHALHGAAARAGLAPAIVAASAVRGALVTEFLSGRHWSAQELQDRGRLWRLGERLAALHAVRLPAGPWRFDPQALYAQYVARAARASGPALPGEASAARTRIESIGRQLGEAVARVHRGAAPEAVPAALIHGDLVCGNLLEGRRLWLLDFEYAQLADPMFDIGCLLAYYPALAAQRGTLLQAVGLGCIGHAERLPGAMYVYRALSWAWHLARGEPGEDPGEFTSAAS